MQICKNVILPLAIFSTASRLWTPPTRPVSSLEIVSWPKDVA